MIAWVSFGARLHVEKWTCSFATGFLMSAGRVSGTEAADSILLRTS